MRSSGRRDLSQQLLPAFRAVYRSFELILGQDTDPRVDFRQRRLAREQSIAYSSNPSYGL